MTPVVATPHAEPAPATAASVRLAGFTPAGTLDWPGKVAATLLVSGCDFRCPYCHSPHLVSSASSSGGWAEFREYLRRRRNWVDGVVVTGGEPTDDPSLAAMLDEFAQEGIPVRLETNGSHPELLGRLIAERLVDFVAVDVKTTFDRYEMATGRPDAGARVRESVRTVIASGVEHEFRTTVFPGIITSAQTTGVARELTGGALYALQQFRPARTLDSSARSVTPEPARDLARAALECSRFLPTVTRGV